ncbi:exopolysaccharide biosynthesis protein [Synechococcus sp. PCC 7336]|uniref:exopolysaccharide biosynthesis protein n=1 Tax=Synechococcus sp. PCC 7336 TaxID=195250 RepID=UPI0003479960|nr:exopolysaccharide biosynthesis protein [Synechococcus sp. PCC 7336]
MARLSQDLDTFLQSPDRGDRISLKDIQLLAGERGFGFFLVLLALPSGLPIPAAGYSVPFGVALFFLATQMIAGTPQPWLPGEIARWSVPTAFATSVLGKGRWLLSKIELIARPRWPWMCQRSLGRRVLGMAIALMAISMMLPFPLTNTAPAFSIVVMGAGLLEDDGPIAAIGLLLSGLAAALTLSILLLLKAGLEQVPGALQWLQRLLEEKGA